MIILFFKTKINSLSAILFFLLIISLCMMGCNSYTPENIEQNQIELAKPIVDDIDPNATVSNANEAQAEEINPDLSEKLMVHFLDVGQADSILIQFPNAQTMLIDAGNNSDADFVTNYLKSAGIKKIDYLIGTHPHEDHIGGLDAVIKDFEIGKVIMPDKTHSTETFKDVLSAIQNKGLKITKAEAGKVLLDENRINVSLLAPIGNSYEDLNNYSAVIKVTFGKTSFLFTGDAEDISEFEMLAQGISLKADILKIGHHGSNSSTSKEFLEAVDPTYAVISVGVDNDYGHPTSETIKKLNDGNVKIYRTDKDSTLIFTSDGNSILISQLTTSETEYVGNINSHKYHYPSCSGAKKILPDNLVTFMNKADAETQGFVPCKICNP